MASSPLAEADYTVKMMLAGPSGGGKSSITAAFAGEPIPKSYVPTIGVDFSTRRMTHPIHTQGYTLRVQLWDTAGQERFRAITRSYYRGSRAMMYVYLAHDRESFRDCVAMMNDTSQYMGSEGIRFLVAHEWTGRASVITSGEAQTAAQASSAICLSCNATIPESVTDLFHTVLGQCTSRLKSDGSLTGAPGSKSGTPSTPAQSSGGWMASIITHLKQSAATAAATAARPPLIAPVSVATSTELAAEWQAAIDEEKMATMICDAKFGAMRSELLAQA